MKAFQMILFFSVFLFSRIAITAAPAGYVVYWGYVPDSAPWPSTNVVTIGEQVLTNAVAVSAGNGCALAIRNDSTVVGWGYNNHGQATGVPTAERASGVVKLGGQILSNIVAIAAGGGSSLALKDNGAVAAWGDNRFGHVTMPMELSNVVAIANGLNGYCVLKSDGTVVECNGGSCQSISSLSNIVAIATIRQPFPNVTVLKNDGTVGSWSARGSVDFHLIDGLSNVTAIAVGDLQGLALKKDGTVVGWEYTNDLPAGLTNIVAISAGAEHGLALKKDGTVITWSPNPLKGLAVPAGLSNVVAIAAGNGFSLAITTNRAVAEKFRH